MQEEIWKDIPGYEGIYRISSLGRAMGYERSWISGEFGNIVKSLSDRFLKVHFDKDGYEVFGVRGNGRNSALRVHRAVALALLPNPENKSQVNHINGIKTDNRLCNLEWATAKENVRHAWATGLSKPSIQKSKKGMPKGKLVLDTSTGIYYGSSNEAHRSLGLTYSTVSLTNRLNGKVKNNTSLVYV